MGYTALLFCPEEKTARTVTQVLSELEFTVEACIEPFAAVKKLMGQHFDAVVVDCDNEQNATLLFKSARNSASNQTSLAVAVVEGPSTTATASDVWLDAEFRALLNNNVAFCSLSQSTTTASKCWPISFLTAAKGSMQASTVNSSSLRTCVTVRAVFSSGQKRRAV